VNKSLSLPVEILVDGSINTASHVAETVSGCTPDIGGDCGEVSISNGNTGDAFESCLKRIHAVMS